MFVEHSPTWRTALFEHRLYSFCFVFFLLLQQLLVSFHFQTVENLLANPINFISRTPWKAVLIDYIECIILLKYSKTDS